ncbi:MAG TPA: diguanylate cyclase [Anaerolineales bacterium]|nr:diguanylate cyclase [Anaerolineales bacterium]
MFAQLTRQISEPLAEAVKNPLTLTFADPEVELAYRSDAYERSLSRVRLAVALGGVMYALFGVLDRIVIPEAVWIAWSIRYGILVPISAIVFGLSYTRLFRRWMEAALVLMALVGGVGIIIMSAAAVEPGNYLYYVGLLQVVTLAFTFARPRFVLATGIAWILFLLYLFVATQLTPTPTAILLSNVAAFLAFNTIGMLAHHSLESYTRSDFLQRRLIAEQTARLEDTLFEVEAQRREAEERARIDPLTSLFNRRHFFAMLDYTRAQGLPAVRQLSVLILDLDHFKQVNDTHGHRAGDQVLQAVSQIIRFCVREGDIACRYGGEEFAILLPGADLQTALTVGERLRESLERTEIPTEFGQLHVTVSIGAGCLEEGDDPDLDSLLDRADTALYAAKHAGRNRVHPPRAAALDRVVAEDSAPRLHRSATGL